jgi:xylulokinase
VESLLGNSHDLASLDSLSEPVGEGSEGVYFVPGLSGERVPFWNPDIRGTIFGLGKQHRIQHLYHAVMESNGFTIRGILDIICRTGLAVKRIIAIGGGAKSALWLRIKSDITGKPVIAPENNEATTLGCTKLAILACDPDTAFTFETPNTIEIEPNKENGEKYTEFYKRYLKLIELCSEFYTETNNKESGG